MKSLTIVLEHKDQDLWASITSEGSFMLTTVGEDRKEITENLKDLLVDFIENEGQEKPEWKDVKIEDIQFDYQYDLTSFFEIYKDVKISAIAKRANISEQLMRQYARGLAYVSAERVKVIEKAVRELGKELMEVTLS